MSSFILFTCISIILVIIILAATYFINIPTNDYEKHSAYECGFEPFGDARSFFDIHFYTIGLLFIIFDLEVVFLIPAVVDIANISLVGYINLMGFLLVVLIGFYYEWAIGLLNWLPKKISVLNTQNIITIITIYEESTSAFLVALFLITSCLLLNQLNNLIYRVINLAGLSILVVGTWAYFTDLTFLYIVYILAFTGAVVMLFLSVILMLPASVTSGIKTTSLLFIITEVTHNNVNLLFINSVIYYLLIIGFIGFYYIISYLKPNYQIMFEVIVQWLVSLKQLSFYSYLNINQLMLTFKKFILTIKEITGISAPTDIYGAFTKNSINMSALPIFSYIGLYWQNILYYIYINVESNLYNGISKTMYIFTNPVWGQLFMVLEYGYAPAKSFRQSSFPIPDVRKPYVPAKLRYSLFTMLPYTISIVICKYLHGNSNLILWINRTIFIINLIAHFIVNIIFNFFAYLYVNDCIDLALIKQIVIIFSIVSISVPLTFSSLVHNWNNIIYTNNYQTLDSLLAIKEIMYETNVLFLVVSVIGLLIALIGSAVFTRNK